VDAPPPAPLVRHAPVLRYAAAEDDRATAVEALVAGPPRGPRVTLRPRRRPLPDVVHGRAVRGRDGRTWLQYWLLYATNEQDRGIVRTGRHEGDWELVQVGLRRGRPEVVTFAQHSWAEACAWTRVRREGARPVVFVAHASHASYPRPGAVDRPWPDPTDEADGRGRTARPRVEPFGAWAAWPGRWGRAEASWVPGEQSSPRGPLFQDAGRDPAAFHAEARACGSGPPPQPWPLVAVVVLALALVALLGTRIVGQTSRRG
jgi:hypothetical protein